MKPVAKHSRSCKLLEFVVQFYLKNLGWCCLEIALNRKSTLIVQTEKDCTFLCCFCNTLHTFLLAWIFFLCWWYSYGEMSFKKLGHMLLVEWWLCTFILISLPCSTSGSCTGSTMNVKWSILDLPEFAWHFIIWFRMVLLSNLINVGDHLVIFFFPSNRVEGVVF